MKIMAKGNFFYSLGKKLRIPYWIIGLMDIENMVN